MRIEIWSDIACPWCYIGKTRFEKALAAYEHKDAVEVVWRSFELQPDSSPTAASPTIDHLMAKYGRSREEIMGMMAQVTSAAQSEGLEFNLDKGIMANTFDAHRLVHLATSQGIGRQVMERFMQAYQRDGANVADHDTLTQLATESGLDSEAVARVLDSDAYAAEVRADEERARQLGVSGVPFFVFDGTQGISGAQPTDYFLGALRQLGPQVKPVAVMGGADGAVCDSDGCQVPSN